MVTRDITKFAARPGRRVYDRGETRRKRFDGMT